MNEVDINDIECIIIENEETKDKIFAALDKAVSFDFISAEKCASLKEKIQTYAEHLANLPSQQ